MKRRYACLLSYHTERRSAMYRNWSRDDPVRDAEDYYADEDETPDLEQLLGHTLGIMDEDFPMDDEW